MKHKIQIWQCTLIGVLFGLCFPLTAYLLTLQDHDLAITWSNIVKVQQINHVLYITALAPIVLGLCFGIIGGFMQKQMDYLVSMASLEKSLRDPGYNSNQKYSLRTVRKAYVVIISFVTVMLIAGLVGILLSQTNEIRRSALVRYSAMQLHQIESSEHPNVQHFNEVETLFNNALDEGFMSPNERLSEKLLELKASTISLNEKAVLAKGILYNVNLSLLTQSAIHSRSVSFIAGILAVLALCFLIYSHFYIFTPNFMSVQRAIYENTAARHTIHQQAEELQEAIQERQETLEQLNLNMETALRVQNVIESTFSYRDNFHSDWFFTSKPLQVLSGDFMWHRELDNTRSLWFLGDSVGHGVAGHLQANLYKTLLGKITNTTVHPVDILNELHERISSLPQQGNDLSCEGCMLLVDVQTGDIQIAAAGIGVVVLKDGNIEKINPQKFVIGSRHINQPLELQHYKIEPGSWLLMASDGLKNALNVNDVRLGNNGVLSMFQKQVDQNKKKFKEQIERSIDAFTVDAALNDDISVLAIQPILTND